MNEKSITAAYHTPTLSVERVRLPACVLAAHARTDHLLLLYQAPAVIVRRVRGNKQDIDRFVTGDVGIYPAGEYGPINSSGPVNNIVISLPEQHLNHFAETRLNLTRLELFDQFRTQNTLISAIGQALLTKDPQGTPLELLYVESLMEALCHHLVQHGTRQTKRVRPETGKLTAAVLTQIDAFLNAHTDQPISVETLAELAHCSLFHFSRLFKNTTGQSPYQYVLAYKVELAKRSLKNRYDPITDIAYRLGFSSVGHFDRFFRQQTGLTPSAYRQQ